MQVKLINQNEWIFSDSTGNDYTELQEIHSARQTRFGFQVLLEDLSGMPKVEIEEIDGICFEVGEMLPVGVDENTAPKMMTTKNYEECREYVTRKAPFFVYDCILDRIEEKERQRRLLYIRARVGGDVVAGDYSLSLTISDKESVIRKCINLSVYPIVIPKVNEGRVEVFNFFSYELLAKEHGVERGSKAYADIFKKYLKLEMDLGQTHIMLPLPEVIYNEKKEVEDFDFTEVVQIADLAIAAGIKYIVGNPVAHWSNWDGSNYHLLWDKSVDVCSTEGYLQLKKYYEKWLKIVKEKGYLPYLYHSLADEPQIPNAVQYRALAGIFRRFMPEVPLIEAVEAIELGGALDVWVPKGETFERWEKEYRKLMENGENFWYYTCAFPAGAYMNRSMDLPAMVSRYTLWMVPYYGMNGFLHWGFNYYHGENVWEKACSPHKEGLLPAGDAHIVYPLGKEVYPSLRFELQREGRDEAEAFYMLRDEDLRKKLIGKAVSGQNRYQTDSRQIEQIKKELYTAIVKQDERI